MDRKFFLAAHMLVLAIVIGVTGGGWGTPAAARVPGSGEQIAQASSGQSGPANHQEYQDVPQTNTFFIFIRNLTRDGIVGGYPCGGSGEPCVPPENLSYYRPSAYVTRAQMSKFADLVRKQPGIFINTSSHGNPIFSRTTVTNGRAVQGESTGGNAIHGVSGSTTASGVYGENTASGYGVAGRSGGGGSAVFGDNTNVSGYAGYFNGNARVVGNLSKGGGSFEIDHPLDPANKYLYHSFVESPDMMNIYNGNATLDEKGEAVVEMPAWFEALNREFRYQLTAIGAPGPNLYVAEEIKNNRFKIAGGTAGMKVSWQVTGVRHDPYANEYRIPVEKEKPAGERGYYLHPEVYGQPESKSVLNAREGK